MGSNTKIYLNSHAKTEEVFKVILKIVGNDFIQSNSSKMHVNKNKPSEYGNGWHVKFPKDPLNQIKHPSKDSYFDPYFDFSFKDCVGGHHSCMYFFEGYDSDYSFNNEKIMNPSSTPLWGIIGKRLVDFFGGKVLFCDSANAENPDNWHVCDKPKYPPKLEGESSNDKWYRYQNALFNEPLITAQELKDMYDKTRYDDEDTKNLINYLEKYEAAQALSDSLRSKDNKKPTSKKIKV